MEILEQIELRELHNYMKACARVARLGRKAKILEQIARSGPYNYVGTHAGIARLALNDR